MPPSVRAGLRGCHLLIAQTDRDPSPGEADGADDQPGDVNGLLRHVHLLLHIQLQ
jgi:hypothetical protein